VILLASLIIAGVVAWAALRIAGELRAARDEAARGRAIGLLQLFTPAVAAAQTDPRALLVWQPLAKTARQLFPAEFADLDRASGATFPFTSDQLQAAHAQWTADWLVWERAHDADYKLKAAMVEQEIGAQGASPILRSKLEAVDREKLDLYQRRYQDYVRVAKALQALTS
jgi:hypothetical protein